MRDKKLNLLSMSGTIVNPQPRRRRPAWPVVVGTISILISVGALVAYGIKLALFDLEFVGVVDVIVQTLIPTVLLAAGIELVQRKETGRKLHVLWGYAFFFALVGDIVWYLMHSRAVTMFGFAPTLREMTPLIVQYSIEAVYMIFVMAWMTRPFASKDLAKW